MKKPVLREIDLSWTKLETIQCMQKNQEKLLKYIEHLEQQLHDIEDIKFKKKLEVLDKHEKHDNYCPRGMFGAKHVDGRYGDCTCGLDEAIKEGVSNAKIKSNI